MKRVGGFLETSGLCIGFIFSFLLIERQRDKELIAMIPSY